MPMTNNSTLQNLGLAGATATAVVSLLSIKYHDRPLFYEHVKGIPHTTGYPLLGRLTALVKNIHRLHDYHLESFELLDALTM